MYICYDCKETFEHPDYRREYMGEYWGVPAYEDISCCPYCGSDDCGEYEEIEEEEE